MLTLITCASKGFCIEIVFYISLMEYLQLPLPDFNFSEHIKFEAQEFIETHFVEQRIVETTKHIRPDHSEHTKREISDKVYFYHNIEDRLIFISEILTHLSKLKSKEQTRIISMSSIGSMPQQVERNDLYYRIIESYQFYIYNICSKIGYNLDRNTFSPEEVHEQNLKIDDIIDTLNRIFLSQQLLYDEIQELKQDLQSLKSDYVLGKKRWYQRFAGIAANYVVGKSADEVWAAILPKIKEILFHSPHLKDELFKLIG
jgi:hypothetical protein